MLKQNYCLTAHEAVYEIAKPIMIYLALQCFQYSRIYQNGSRVELATNPKHLQLAFIEKPFMRQVFTPTLASAEERYLSIPHWIASLPKAAQDPLSQKLNLHFLPMLIMKKNPTDKFFIFSFLRMIIQR